MVKFETGSKFQIL